jgi:hypothetical protein
MKPKNTPTALLVLTAEEAERFDANVAAADANGCRMWTAGGNSNGYGVFNIVRNGVRRSRYAHRTSAVRAFGVFDEDLLVDHICHQRRCVTPEHLRLVTNSGNQQNRRGANSRSASGVRGVWWIRQAKRYMGEVRTSHGILRTPYCKTLEEAEERVVAIRREAFPFSVMDQAKEPSK